ncbi:MAG TPA: hypothetical protein PKH65_02415 [Bacteroidia bacterium]|nr:hypothetical protein [Bacteroidia bacterium]HNT79510.1 hypothetical protein [Bacteroidia bacterium]
MKKYFFIFFIGLCACTTAPKESTTQAGCFDLKSYFIAQAQLLDSLQATLAKQAAINDSSDYINIEKPDWKNEFSYMIQSSMSCDNWPLYYALDSLHENQLLTLRYKAIDEKRELQQCRISFKENEPVLIVLQLSDVNKLFSSQTVLTYVPMQEIKIEALQKSSVQKEKRIQIISTIKIPS